MKYIVEYKLYENVEKAKKILVELKIDASMQIILPCVKYSKIIWVVLENSPRCYSERRVTRSLKITF